MFRKLFTVLVAILTISACAGERAAKVTTLQKKDKSLDCAQVQLEINEAEYYRQSAEKKKSIGLTSLVMPISYISTYMNANDAVKSSNERIDYLNRIYDIRKCDELNQRMAQGQGSTSAYMAPVQYAPSHNYRPPAQAYAPINPYGYAAPMQQVAPNQQYYRPMAMQQKQPSYGDDQYYRHEPVPDYLIDGYW